tara:strand:- start:1241 stop:1693 length:453 start_codon:yes stop_codon:yes gene_type:complete
LNYNWNVYKIFKNGKRAKAPITQFEASEEDHVSFFEEEVRKNLSNSLRNGIFKLIRADLPQERATEKSDEINDKFSKDKSRILGRLAAEAGIDNKRPISTALVYYSESGWRWQWAAIESGTSRYIEGLSPKFDTTEEAEEWIHEKISSSQ